jgi:hypothetical protein
MSESTACTAVYMIQSEQDKTAPWCDAHQTIPTLLFESVFQSSCWVSTAPQAQYRTMLWSRSLSLYLPFSHSLPHPGPGNPVCRTLWTRRARLMPTFAGLPRVPYSPRTWTAALLAVSSQKSQISTANPFKADPCLQSPAPHAQVSTVHAQSEIRCSTYLLPVHTRVRV